MERGILHFGPQRPLMERSGRSLLRERPLVHHSKIKEFMSALGQKRTYALQQKGPRSDCDFCALARTSSSRFPLSVRLTTEIQWRCGASSCGSDRRVKPPSSIHFIVDCAASSLSSFALEKSNGDTASGQSVGTRCTWIFSGIRSKS